VTIRKIFRIRIFDPVRELAVEAKKQGLTLNDIAAHIRLHTFFIKSGIKEEQIEPFITNISSTEVPTETVIELVNQMYNISKEESIPLDQVSGYINKKLEEKQKIDEHINIDSNFELEYLAL
jgi:hypothetical protein